MGGSTQPDVAQSVRISVQRKQTPEKKVAAQQTKKSVLHEKRGPEVGKAAKQPKERSWAVTVLWIVSVLGFSLSTSYWIKLLFEPLGVPRASLALKLSQPLISIVMFCCTTDYFACLTNLQHHHLPAIMLYSVPLVFLSATALTTGLFAIHVPGRTMRYGIQTDKEFLTFVGMCEGFCYVVALLGLAFFCCEAGVAKSWKSATLERVSNQLPSSNSIARKMPQQVSATTHQICYAMLLLVSVVACGLVNWCWINIALTPFEVVEEVGKGVKSSLGVVAILLVIMTSQTYARLAGSEPTEFPSSPIQCAAAMGWFASFWAIGHNGILLVVALDHYPEEHGAVFVLVMCMVMFSMLALFGVSCWWFIGRLCGEEGSTSAESVAIRSIRKAR